MFRSPRNLLTRHDGFELVERRLDQSRQVARPGLIHPAIECDSEDGDPCFSGQARGGLSDAAAQQRIGHSRGERCHLDELALLKLRVGSNDRLTASPVLPAPALVENDAGSVKSGRDRVDRRRQRFALPRASCNMYGCIHGEKAS